MLRLGTILACITVDGNELPQYVIEDSVVEGKPHVTCWIASEAGKVFEYPLKALALNLTINNASGILCCAQGLPLHY